MREIPPSSLINAGMRSSAMTATAPASSAIRACSGFITSIMTPPLSISARPTFTSKLDLLINKFLFKIITKTFNFCCYVFNNVIWCRRSGCDAHDV